MKSPWTVLLDELYSIYILSFIYVRLFNILSQPSTHYIYFSLCVNNYQLNFQNFVSNSTLITLNATQGTFQQRFLDFSSRRHTLPTTLYTGKPLGTGPYAMYMYTQNSWEPMRYSVIFIMISWVITHSESCWFPVQLSYHQSNIEQIINEAKKHFPVVPISKVITSLREYYFMN